MRRVEGNDHYNFICIRCEIDRTICGSDCEKLNIVGTAIHGTEFITKSIEGGLVKFVPRNPEK